MFNTLKILIFVVIFGLVSCSNLNPTSTLTTDSTTDEPTLTDSSLSSGSGISEIPSNTFLKIGDQMYDFAFTNTNGELKTFSKELEEKKVIAINIFASWCAPCVAELPVMQESYEKYDEKVSIFALSVERTDTLEFLKENFQNKHSLTYDIGQDEMNVAPLFFEKSHGDIILPATAIIDKFGTVVEIHNSPLNSVSMWDDIFEKYTDENYEGIENPGDSNGPSSSEIEETINDSSYSFGYYLPTGEEAEENYPWLISEKHGAIYPSNSLIDDSYSIINSDFEVTDLDNNVLMFDYLSSTEKYDILYVKINGETVAKISGVTDEWQSLKVFEPKELGTYTLTLMYKKDTESKVGEDLVYVKNMRFVSKDSSN